MLIIGLIVTIIGLALIIAGTIEDLPFVFLTGALLWAIGFTASIAGIL